MPEALRTLVGGLAHELNNMLYVIQGYSDILLEDLAAQPKHQSLAAEIQTANQKAQAIVSALGLLADPPPGGDCNAPYALLKEFAKRRLSNLPPGIVLRHRGDPEPPPLCVDAAAFHALLENLLREGLSFVGDADGVIEFRFGRQEDAGAPCLWMQAQHSTAARQEGAEPTDAAWTASPASITDAAANAHAIAKACATRTRMACRITFDAGCASD